MRLLIRLQIMSLLLAPCALAEPDRPDAGKARGVIAAADEAVITTALSARLDELPFDLGERFEKGALLAKFNCERMRAELGALDAERRSLAKTHKGDVELFERGAAGAFDVEKGKADLDRASAEAQAKRAQLSDCEIRAPYSGFIAARHADPFETPEPGAPLLKIIKDGPLEIQMIAPAAWIARVKKGASFVFAVNETGASYRAEIIRVGVAIDPASQTVDMVGRFVEPTPSAVAGMSGLARLNAPGI